MKLALDKKLHLAAGFAIAVVTFVLMRDVIIAAGAAAAAGVLKEVYDWTMNMRTRRQNDRDAALAIDLDDPAPEPSPLPHGVEFADGLYTIAGGVAGSVAANFVVLFLF